jgi:carbon-monoxide dehydrogenase medium subunit
MYDFEYHKPQSLADAAAVLAGKEDGKLLAGGMTFIPTLKQRLAHPTDVIDLAAIAELKGIKREGDAVVIGAMTRHVDVATSAVVKSAIPGLAQLAEMIGDPAVRNRGTLGGSVANNDPAADYPGAVLGLGATIITNRRRIAADDFFTGMFETALEPEEILTAISFPIPQKSYYTKFPNPASRYAMAGAFVARTAAGVRVAITGAAPCAYRWTAAEAALDKDFSVAALAGLTVEADGLNSDIHASAEYRAHLITVMTRRAVAPLV